jgi:hypothetical protein
MAAGDFRGPLHQGRSHVSAAYAGDGAVHGYDDTGFEL